MTFSSQAISRAIPMIQIEVNYLEVTEFYTQIGIFPNAVEMMSVVSTFDQPVTLSFDAVNDYITVPAGNSTPVFLQYNFKENRMVLNNAIFYVVNVLNMSPSVGNLYISAFSSTIP